MGGAWARVSGWVWGPLSSLGAAIALLACLADQASKNYLLAIYHLGDRGVVPVTSFLNLVLAWNTGISYSLLPQQGPMGQAILLIAKAIAILCLWVWMAQARTRITALSLGLIIGGALGNAIDGLRFGAVVDFVHFHITTATWHFSWYIFNLADTVIVAGVIGLLYESFFADYAAKEPGSGA